MRLLILADLHLDEITDVELLHMLGNAIASAGKDADALIIAGDLAEDAMAHWSDAIRWLGKYYPTKQTIFIPGNHDYYGGHLSCQRQSKSEPKGSAKCCHFGVGIISVQTSASIRASALVI